MMNLIRAQNGEWSLGEVEGGYVRLIHSVLDPSREGQFWAEQFAVEEKTVYVVLGCALGYHIRALRNHIPVNSGIIAIVSKNELQCIQDIKQRIPLNSFKSGEALFIVQAELHDMAVVATGYMLEKKIKKMKLCFYRPAMELAKAFYDTCKNLLINNVEQIMSGTLNVLFWSGQKFALNLCANLFWIARCPGVERLGRCFSPETPVVIVGSGPSLDKNIHILKNMQEDAIIIAAGSAMVALKKANIVPHFLFVADASDKMHEVLKDSFHEDTILCSSYLTHSNIISEYPGKIIFATSQDVPPLTSLEPHLPKTRKLNQAVSVSTLAVDFALACGAQKIVLVGQDLSYPYGQENHHAKGVVTNSYSEDEALEIPGYYGGIVRSFPSLKLVVDFFTACVKNYPNITFINATEGGAKIEGMQQNTLLEIADSVKGQVWGIKNSQKIREKIYSYKPRKQKIIAEKIHCMEMDLRFFSGKIKDTIEVLVDAETEVKIEAYSMLFDKNSTRNVMEILHNVITPRLQTIEFYKQESTSNEEVHLMYEGMAKDIQFFCLMLSELLKGVHEKLEESV